MPVWRGTPGERNSIYFGEHLLRVRPREADREAADGCLAEVQRIAGQIRARWSQVHPVSARR